VYAVDADANLSWYQLRPEQQAMVVQNYQSLIVLKEGRTSNFTGSSSKVIEDYLKRMMQEARFFEWK
jgi:hypothetical protein